MKSGEQAGRILQRISLWSFFLAGGIGLASLLAWISGVIFVLNFGLDRIPIAPSTAFCFLVLSAALFAHAQSDDSKTRWKETTAGAVLVFSICLTLLAGFFLGKEFQAEHLFFQPLPSVANVPSGHMSPITAMTFLMAAMGTLLLVFFGNERPHFKQAAALLAAAVILIGFIVILGYLHGTPFLYGGTIIPVAFSTAIAFVLLGLGMTASAGPSVPFVRVFIGATVRSRLMRAFLPAVAFFVLIDGLMYKTTLASANNPALIAALIAVLSIIVVVFLISRIAKSLGDEIESEHVKRLRMEDEVRSLASIIQNIPNGVYIFNVKGEVISWNRGAEKMLGYRAEEIVGKPASAIIPEELVAEEKSVLTAALNSLGDFSSYESARLAKNGGRIPVELSGVAIRDAAQAISSYAFVMSDITTRKNTEQERLKSHMLESIGMLAGGIAHDFNNLLAVILGDIHMAKMHLPAGDKAYGRLADAEQICGMATELSSRLITFSTGGDPQKKQASMTGLLTKTVGEQLAGTNIVSELDMPSDLYTVAIDEGQMNQVIKNLAINAKEVMPRGGKLTVRGENLHITAQDRMPLREGHYLKISLRDTGPGIPEEHLAKIFDPYFSTKDTFSQKGLGLGLAVCYSVISRHNGLIAVESEIGKGTSFSIYLPAVDQT